MSPARNTRGSSPTVNVASPSRTTKISSYGCRWSAGPSPGAASTTITDTLAPESSPITSWAHDPRPRSPDAPPHSSGATSATDSENVQLWPPGPPPCTDARRTGTPGAAPRSGRRGSLHGLRARRGRGCGRGSTPRRSPPRARSPPPRRRRPRAARDGSRRASAPPKPNAAQSQSTAALTSSYASTGITALRGIDRFCIATRGTRAGARTAGRRAPCRGRT